LTLLGIHQCIQTISCDSVLLSSILTRKQWRKICKNDEKHIKLGGMLERDYLDDKELLCEALKTF
jgi:hypothetical protein